MAVDAAAGAAGPPSLAERLERLRHEAERHRLGLALACADIVEQTRNLRRVISIAFAIVGPLLRGRAGRLAPGASGAARVANAILPRLLPVIVALMGARGQRIVRALRAALAAGALGMFVARWLRRARRHPPSD
jgi:hypothetical protein